MVEMQLFWTSVIQIKRTLEHPGNMQHALSWLHDCCDCCMRVENLSEAEMLEPQLMVLHLRDLGTPRDFWVWSRASQTSLIEVNRSTKGIHKKKRKDVKFYDLLSYLISLSYCIIPSPSYHFLAFLDPSISGAWRFGEVVVGGRIHCRRQMQKPWCQWLELLVLRFGVAAAQFFGKSQKQFNQRHAINSAIPVDICVDSLEAQRTPRWDLQSSLRPGNKDSSLHLGSNCTLVASTATWNSMCKKQGDYHNMIS